MKVVVFGGGTGLSNILTGFKKDVGKTIKKLTAVVTVSDSGGSSGILKKIFDIPAVGDLRNCLLSLANIEVYAKEIMQHRFKKGNGLKGHPLGNLFLVALMDAEGDLFKAVKKASKILNISGEIMPSTLDKVELKAVFENKKEIIGEEKIVDYRKKTGKKIISLKLLPLKVNVPKEVLERIKKADLILFSPGSLYTSILPNLLIQEIKNAVDNAKAIKVFIVNLLTQPGETDNFSASDHVREFLKISGLKKIDVVVINKQKPPAFLIKRMKKENKFLVKPDINEIKKMKIKIFLRNLINEKDIYIKHDPLKLRKVIFKIAKDYGII